MPKTMSPSVARLAAVLAAGFALVLALGGARLAAAQDAQDIEANAGTEVFAVSGSGTVTGTAAVGCQALAGVCADAFAGAFGGSPLAGGGFSGSLTSSGFVQIDAATYEAAGSGSITLEDLAGNTLTVSLEGTATTGLATPWFQGFGGIFSSTGGTGLYAGRFASGVVSMASDGGAMIVTLDGSISALVAEATATLPPEEEVTTPIGVPTSPPVETVVSPPAETVGTATPEPTPTSDPAVSGSLVVNVATCRVAALAGTFEYLPGTEGQPVGDCAAAPGQAVTVRSTTGSAVYQGVSDGQGAIALDLPADTYVAAVAGDDGIAGGSQPTTVEQGQTVSMLVIGYVADEVGPTPAAPAEAASGFAAVSGLRCPAGGSGTEIRASAPKLPINATAGDGVAVDDPTSDDRCTPGDAEFAIYPFGDTEADPAGNGGGDGMVELPTTTGLTPHLIQALDEAGAVLAQAEFDIAAGASTEIVIVRYPAGGGAAPTAAPAASPIAADDGTGIDSRSYEAGFRPGRYAGFRPGSRTGTSGVSALPNTGAGTETGADGVWVLAALLIPGGIGLVGGGLTRRRLR